MKRSFYFAFRCASIGFFALCGPSMGEEMTKMLRENGAMNRLPLWACLGPFLAIILVTQIKYRAMWQHKGRETWTKPNWFSNPFANPVVFNQIAGFAFAAMGLTGLLTSAQKGHAETMNVFPMAVGMGLIVSSTIFFAFNEDKLPVKPR